MKSEYEQIFIKMKSDPNVLKMSKFKHHVIYTTYDHCLNVTKVGIFIGEKLKLSEEQMNNLIVGAMLHDYFLYDYYDGRITKDGIPAWSHSKVALRNAEKQFELNDNQRNIIRSHMFPTTLLHPPKCKEAFIVCISDKLCAIYEILNGFLQKMFNRKFNGEWI